MIPDAGRFVPHLVRRGTSARAITTCSDFGFDTIITHEPRPPAGTPMQRLIERSLVLKSTGFALRLGDLELSFVEQDLLTHVGIYGRLLPESLVPWEEAATNAAPMLLTFPALSVDEHLHSMDCSVRAYLDKAHGRLDVQLGPIRPSTAGLLADDLIARIDEAGLIAGFQARGATWTDDLSGA